MKKKLLLLPIVLLLLAAAGFVVWGSTPFGPDETALAALRTDNLVWVENDRWLEFAPIDSEPTTALIFYPGGRVDYRSYAPLARAVAQAGYLVIIPAMPLNLAVFNIHAADDVIAAHPEVTDWAVGGHSLGGAMAAQYAADQPELVSGLLLLASYPAGNVNLSALQLQVTSVYGSRDQVADQNTIRSAQALLPAETTWVEIQGGNHAQFGAYGPQPGDGSAQISTQQQLEQAASAAIALLDGLE